MKNTDNSDLIVKCLADKFLPLSLVLGLYVILHGNISPGGGFQGGVLVSSAVLLLYLAYGYKGAAATISGKILHKGEAFGAICYIVFAMLGIFYGFNFCRNVLFSRGEIGDIWSSGTIALMNYAVGLKVLTGVGFLLMLVIGLLAADPAEKAPDASEGGELK
ncbi:MAG TPA: cation:proton antiporter [Clostridiales bacterium]|nr:cation:proton antiporter [Clostridiales bacterium]